MDDEGPGGLPKWVIFAGVGVVAVVIFVWYRNKQSASSSTASTTNGGAYGAPIAGSGVIEPIVIQSPGTPGAPGPAGPPGKAATAAKPPTKSLPPPKPANSSGNTATIAPSEQYESQVIGDFGSLWKLKTPTQAQVAAEEKKVGGVSTLGQRLQVENWNVGQLGTLNRLKTPTAAQVTALAKQENPDFASVGVSEQSIMQQLANIELLERLNPRPA